MYFLRKHSVFLYEFNCRRYDISKAHAEISDSSVTACFIRHRLVCVQSAAVNTNLKGAMFSVSWFMLEKGCCGFQPIPCFAAALSVLLLEDQDEWELNSQHVLTEKCNKSGTWVAKSGCVEFKFCNSSEVIPEEISFWDTKQSVASQFSLSQNQC